MVAENSVSEDLCTARRAETDRRLGNIESGVGKLLRAWFEGNGNPSMATRLTTMEGEMVEIKRSEEERKVEAKESARQRSQTRLALWTALISGIVGILGVLSRILWG